MKKIIQTKEVLGELIDALSRVVLPEGARGVTFVVDKFNESIKHMESLERKENRFVVAPVTSYGRKEFRPTSKLAEQFAELLEQNNFNVKDLARLKAMGIEVEIDMQAAVEDSIKELTEQMHNLFGMAPKEGGK